MLIAADVRTTSDSGGATRVSETQRDVLRREVKRREVATKVKCALCTEYYRIARKAAPILNGDG